MLHFGLECGRHSSFFVWLATNDLLDVTEIKKGNGADLDQRTINSVLGFSNQLREKVVAGTATVSDLESAMNCAKKLSLLRKRTGARLDSQSVLDALRYVVLGLDEGRINGIYDRHGGTEARRHGGTEARVVVVGYCEIGALWGFFGVKLPMGTRQHYQQGIQKHSYVETRMQFYLPLKKVAECAA